MFRWMAHNVRGDVPQPRGPAPPPRPAVPATALLHLKSSPRTRSWMHSRAYVQMHAHTPLCYFCTNRSKLYVSFCILLSHSPARFGDSMRVCGAALCFLTAAWLFITSKWRCSFHHFLCGVWIFVWFPIFKAILNSAVKKLLKLKS